MSGIPQHILYRHVLHPKSLCLADIRDETRRDGLSEYLKDKEAGT